MFISTVPLMFRETREKIVLNKNTYFFPPKLFYLNDNEGDC
jgi:hypothetical protein